MIAKLKSLMNDAFASLSAFNTSRDVTQVIAENSTAERVGPNRVILNVRLNSDAENTVLGNIGLGVSFRGFTVGKPDEEAVVVNMESGDNDNATPDDTTLLVKRATLTVKSDTKFLSLTFMDSDSRVFKTERVKIK